MRFPRVIIPICLALALAGAAPAFAHEHATAPSQSQPPTEQPAHPAQPAGERGEAGANPVVTMVARLFNFAVLVGALVYFLRAPIAAYLASRDTQIRQDLVNASDMRAAATAQLAGIQTKMSGLPAELEALRHQGVDDVRAEQARIAEAAVQERTRLLDQTRREIDMRLRVAKRELTEHTAQLAVQVAEQRIKRAITHDDQIRLVDRYASQLKEAR